MTITITYCSLHFIFSLHLEYIFIKVLEFLLMSGQKESTTTLRLARPLCVAWQPCTDRGRWTASFSLPPTVSGDGVSEIYSPPALSLLIRVLPTMSEGFSQPLQQETYALVQSIEQRNLSGIFFMLDLTPTRSRR